MAAREVAECGSCWADERNPWCPEHGDEAMLRAAVAHFKADNARLRRLMKDAEHGNAEYSCCPWCAAGDWNYGKPNAPHAPGCPAFTPDGMVR